MKVILTKYLYPTTKLGTRYKATDLGGNSLTLVMDYSLTVEQNHARAARALVKKLRLDGKLTEVDIKDGRAWVLVPDREEEV